MKVIKPLPIPQRQYGQLHDGSYRAQLGLDDPIMFPSHSGQDGILLADVMNEDIYDLVGKDDPMFVNCMSPVISLHILVRSTSAYLEKVILSWLNF